MKIVFSDFGDKECGIRPLEVILKTNEYIDVNDKKWKKDFKEAFFKFVEQWFDSNGRVKVEYEED